MAIDSLLSNSIDILEPPRTTISNMLDATGSYSPSTLIRTPSKRGDPTGHSEGSNDLDRLSFTTNIPSRGDLDYDFRAVF